MNSYIDRWDDFVAQGCYVHSIFKIEVNNDK